MGEMVMWGAIVLAVLLAAIGAVIFLINRLTKLTLIKKISGEKRGKKILFSIFVIAVCFLLVSLLLSAINAILVMLHIILFWIICDVTYFVIRKFTKTKKREGLSGLISVAITVIYLLVGYYLAVNVWETSYSIDTDKNVGEIKIVQFADSHVGTTFSGSEFIKYIEQINACEPDVVLITGDLVDDNTSLKDMKDMCAALSKLETKYGVYFSFGNHDKGYGDNSARGYNGYDLIAELEANGVIVLEDEAVLINDRFYIVGRQDKSEESKGGRASAEALMEGLDPSKYIIFMDHQPNDYKNESEAGCDLILSGHTHGGQLIPVNEVGVWIGANDKTYGHEKRIGTDFIVTSGISDWEILFKTGCKSEFVVVEVK